MRNCLRDRDRERERERKRETERERDREGDRERQRETERQRERERGTFKIREVFHSLSFLALILSFLPFGGTSCNHNSSSSKVSFPLNLSPCWLYCNRSLLML